MLICQNISFIHVTRAHVGVLYLETHAKKLHLAGMVVRPRKLHQAAMVVKGLRMIFLFTMSHFMCVYILNLLCKYTLHVCYVLIILDNFFG